MEHHRVSANGASFHVARIGQGPPLLLLHGWPEFWLSWEPVMTRLADRFTLLAPDLRGFGDSDKPQGASRPGGPRRRHAGIARCFRPRGKPVGVIGHDVGGAAMLALARKAPDRFAGLFFFDFVYPGIGPRMGQPDRLNEIWYQSFHQMEIAPLLIGATRAGCRADIGYGNRRRWSFAQADAFDRGKARRLPRR